MQNTDGESEKEENSDGLKTEKGELQNGGREPDREQWIETKNSNYGQLLPFLEISPGTALPGASEMCCLQKPCPGLSQTSITLQSGHDWGKKAQLRGKNSHYFFSSWFCFKKNLYLTSKYNCQGGRTQVHQAEHILSLNPFNSCSNHHSLPMSTLQRCRYRQPPCFLNTPQEQQHQAAQKPRLPAKP